ncbi:MAG TPA: UbiA family prenyltransferase [Jatrophihabitans sp.]|jgi:4-hydroxybenzoate polyprenyltransferase|nr:UbiA family prenyltransferase [Jatrophihabitans sp.]
MTSTYLPRPVGFTGAGAVTLTRRAARTGEIAVQVISESRPVVQAIFLMRACIAAGMPFQFSVRAAGVLAGWSMLSVAIYVLNGVTDRDGDRVNGSRRPIATGALPPEVAMRAVALLAVAGTALCAAVDRRTLPLTIGFLALGWAYSAGPAFKNRPVGFAATIGTGAALTYAIGWVASGVVAPALIGFGAAMAVWVTLTCAAKDFSDCEGDRLAGRRTWPVLLGAHRAARRLAACAITGSLAMLALAAVVDASLWLVALVVAAGSVALGRTCARSISPAAVSAETARTSRRSPYRVFMSTQYVAHLALVLGAMLA